VDAGAGAAIPQADERPPDAGVPVAVDDGDDELRGMQPADRRRLRRRRRDGGGGGMPLRAAAGGDEEEDDGP
jgi:hypothetical protein